MNSEDQLKEVKEVLSAVVRFEEQRSYLLNVIDELRGSLYSSDTLNSLLYSLPIDLQKIFRKTMSGEEGSVRDKESFLKDIKDEVAGMLSCKVRLARYLLVEEKLWISAELRRIIDENILIEVIIDPVILGGIVVEYDGRIYDYSLRRYL